jgi:serine/threonine-protein kinase
MDDVALERAALRLFEQLDDIAESDRGDWIATQTRGNKALEDRLHSLIAADRLANMHTGGAWLDQDDAPLPERIGAYRITGLIGRGGMGSVYRGERAAGDFAHVVALKVIKPGLLSDALTERFRRERQTLAQLSHPNIAQLFDGGEMPDGAPYIVMELVNGQSLLRWVEDADPTRDERLRMIGTICRAVGFAHRSLVVHRDLTPSNVLVTVDSTPKLIDFGIARAPDLAPSGEASRPPSIGSLSLTPGYAAPERMTSASVSTGADIYSLGKLLAWLLPDQDTELKAIVTQATADDPNDRYPTAEALADDIEAWASGRPVSAMAGGRRYAAAKFIRRNRLPIAAGLLALALLLAALVSALVANHRAQIARAEAEARFEQTRSIAKTLLFEVFDEVSKTPGSTKARQHLAETAMHYLEALAALGSAPRDVRLEAGRGFLRLAEVVGGGQAGSLSKYEDGNALLEKSASILRPLHEAAPDDPEVSEAYAALLLEQSGTNLYNNGKTQLARTQAREAGALLAPLARRGNASRDARYITSLQSEGDSHEWDDDYATARTILEKAEAFAASLPPAQRQAREVMSARSANLRLLGEAHHKLKDKEKARAVLDQALTINRALVQAEPDNPALVRKLVNALRYAAIVHRTNMRDEEAGRAITEAVTQAGRLSARDPNDSGAMHQLALVQEVQAQILTDLGRHQESFAVGDQVLAAHRRIVALAGNAAGARRSLAAAMRTTGGNHYNGRDYAGACALWRETLGLYRALERESSLSESDRKGSMAEMVDYVARDCDNGGPRAGLGEI